MHEGFYSVIFFHFLFFGFSFYLGSIFCSISNTWKRFTVIPLSNCALNQNKKAEEALTVYFSNKNLTTADQGWKQGKVKQGTNSWHNSCWLPDLLSFNWNKKNHRPEFSASKLLGYWSGKKWIDKTCQKDLKQKMWTSSSNFTYSK